MDNIHWPRNSENKETCRLFPASVCLCGTSYFIEYPAFWQWSALKTTNCLTSMLCCKSFSTCFLLASSERLCRNGTQINTSSKLAAVALIKRNKCAVAWTVTKKVCHVSHFPPSVTPHIYFNILHPTLAPVQYNSMLWQYTAFGRDRC